MLPTGQVTGLIDEIPTVAEVVEGIVAEAEATLARLAARLSPGRPVRRRVDVQT